MLTIIVKIVELYLLFKYAWYRVCYEVALNEVVKCHKNDDTEGKAFWSGITLEYYYKQKKASEKLPKEYDV